MIGKENFISKVEGSLMNDYTLIKYIGAGAYGSVYLIEHKLTKDQFACKIIKKQNITQIHKLILEINILIKSDHPNIIKLYEIYEDEKYIYLIMQLCRGGELFDKIMEHISKNTKYTEKEILRIFQQLMSALNYCHSLGICHRDLKLENLLLIDDKEDSHIKVIDFGLSQLFNKDEKMNSIVGSLYYISPEVLGGSYNEKCDIWSAGVILYILLCGELPFEGINSSQIIDRIKNKKYSFNSPQWNEISEDAKDLIKNMLCDADIRYSAQDVLNHKWMTEAYNKENESFLSLTLDNLLNYKNINKLKKAVLVFIASRLSENEIDSLSETFFNYSKDKNGVLYYDDFKSLLMKLSNNKIGNPYEVFKALDIQGKGVVGYTEFLAAAMDQNVYLNDKKLRNAFKAFDIDNDGKISEKELKKITRCDTITAKNLINENDFNNDGVLDYIEFLNMMI